MKKHLKKLLLVVGMVAMTTMTYAITIVIDCGDGSTPHNYIPMGDTIEEQIADALVAADDLC